jgi:hypothetical protein
MVLFLVYARLISRCGIGFLRLSLDNAVMKTRADAAGASRIIHCQIANHGRGLGKASIPEKEPGGLAKLNFANDLSFFGEKEAESGFLQDWQNGNRLNTGLLMRGAGRCL